MNPIDSPASIPPLKKKYRKRLFFVALLILGVSAYFNSALMIRQQIFPLLEDKISKILRPSSGYDSTYLKAVYLCGYDL